MKRAGRYHAARGMVLLGMVALLAWGGLVGHGEFQAAARISSLKGAEITKVSDLIDELVDYRRWARPRLRDALQAADVQPQVEMRFRLALLRMGDGRADRVG